MNALDHTTSRRNLVKLAGAFGLAAGFSASIAACAPSDSGSAPTSTGTGTGDMWRDHCLASGLCHHGIHANSVTASEYRAKIV